MFPCDDDVTSSSISSVMTLKLLSTENQTHFQRTVFLSATQVMCSDKTHTTTNFTSGYDLTLQPTQFSGKLSTKGKSFVLYAPTAPTQQVPCTHQKQYFTAGSPAAATQPLELSQGQKLAETCGLEESARRGKERSTFWQPLTIRSVYL